jgi:hypothetical protein
LVMKEPTGKGVSSPSEKTCLENCRARHMEIKRGALERRYL